MPGQDMRSGPPLDWMQGGPLSALAWSAVHGLAVLFIDGPLRGQDHTQTSALGSACSTWLSEGCDRPGFHVMGRIGRPEWLTEGAAVSDTAHPRRHRCARFASSANPSGIHHRDHRVLARRAAGCCS
jgi:hypothetical protein